MVVARNTVVIPDRTHVDGRSDEAPEKFDDAHHANTRGLVGAPSFFSFGMVFGAFFAPLLIVSLLCNRLRKRRTARLHRPYSDALPLP
jgi:hypothetical protein